MLISGAGFALLSVILGAFAAHALKNRLDEYSIGVFQTAVQYQMSHAIGLLFCGLFAAQLSQNDLSSPWLSATAVCFTLGILFFSGSLYGLALTGQKWLGPITPIGGVFFILGWIALIISVLKR
jgi:uncharacterized membrane protein YgdD (TMEM256/DUF423 family)